MRWISIGWGSTRAGDKTHMSVTHPPCTGDTGDRSRSREVTGQQEVTGREVTGIGLRSDRARSRGVSVEVPEIDLN